MLRKTLTTLSVIGLLLSVGLWGVSYFNVTYLAMPIKSLLQLTEGRLGWIRYAEVEFPVDEYGRQWVELTLYPADSMATFKHAQINQQHRWYRDGYRGLGTRFRPTARSAPMMLWLPLWMPTFLFAVILSLCRPLHHHRRRKRKKLGLCLECGYNLRGLTELRCPECNTPFEKCSAKP